jgi:hypothetical protein
MTKMIKVRAAKKIAPFAATSRRRCPVLAARPGTCICFLARQMCRRPERALPLGVPNAQNKQFMMRQPEKFCKLISHRAESECDRKNLLSGESDSTLCGKSAVGVIPSAARDLLFMQMLSKKQIPRAKFALGMTICAFFRKLFSR